jgi:hypothetical protein
MKVCKGKGKAVPLQARCGPEGSRRFRLPDFHDIRHMKLTRLSASSIGRFHPQTCSRYLFSLGAESTPGPWCGRKEYVNEKSGDTTGTARIVAQRLNHYDTPDPYESMHLILASYKTIKSHRIFGTLQALKAYGGV